MNTYRTQRRLYRIAPGAPARAALALFFLAWIGGLLVALLPPPPARLEPPKKVFLLALSLPEPVIAAPLKLAGPPVIEEAPVPPPQSAPQPVPPAPIVVDAPVVVPPEPLTVVEDTAEPDPAPVSPPLPLAVVAEPEPEPAPVVEIALEPVAEPQPILEASLPDSSDNGKAMPYAAGDLTPDEAVAMPDDVPPPTIVEKPLQEALAETVPTPETPIEHEPLPAAKAPLAPIWLAYARPSVDTRGLPRIAVVVAGLGLGRAATTAAIKLPGGITLAFASHARNLQNWIDLARAAGHEVLLDLPMEPEKYPAIDPGPQALLTSLSEAENAERLEWHLNRAIGYVGVTHNMGSRFTASAEHMRPILSALKLRGLMFLDARTTTNSVSAGLATSMGLPRAINNRFLDSQASRPAINSRIDQIERIARRVGFSVAFGHAYPVTIERLERWAETLDGKKLALVPISALVNLQEAQ